MAVIRAKRLWVAKVSNAYPDVILYQVPAGKRAIVRSIGFKLDNYPPDTVNAPSAQIFIKPAGTPTWLCVWSGWFLIGDYRTQPMWQLWQGWNGQLVLHAGDQVSYQHDYVGTADTWGAGHELNELT